MTGIMVFSQPETMKAPGFRLLSQLQRALQGCARRFTRATGDLSNRLSRYAIHPFLFTSNCH